MSRPPVRYASVTSGPTAWITAVRTSEHCGPGTVAAECERADDAVPGGTSCRFCGAPLRLTVVDLGKSPLCQTVLSEEQLEQVEPFYPLHARACERCWLVQIPEFVAPEGLFEEYAYFSAFSDSWVQHARDYADMITERRGLGSESLVVELASNDGYLLQHFVAAGIPVLGIDPARNVAEAAIERGVPTLVEFFGARWPNGLCGGGTAADLIVGNNVLAQVPDINDFVAGVEALLASDGVATFEFPHLARLLDHLEYDTIYHEHFSYFSFFTIREIFTAHGLTAVDVEELPSHGGSLRVFFEHADESRGVSPAVGLLIEQEENAGLRSPDAYAAVSWTACTSRSGRSRAARRLAARGQARRRATAHRVRATRF